MTDTTEERLSQEREESVRLAVESAIPQILLQVGEVMEKTFATGADVRGMVKDVIKAVTDDAAERIEAVKKEQTAWRIEQTARQDKAIADQNAKMDTFFSDMRARMDTFVPRERVDTLRGEQEDFRKHSESIMGGHGEAIAELKDRFKSIESVTGKSIAAIRADTERIGKSVAVMTNTVAELARRDKKRTEEVDRRLALLSDSDDQTAKDIDAIQDDMRKQEVRLINVEAELKPISAVARALLKLFTTRRGNMALAAFLILFFGFQLVNAWLTYQFIQRIPMLSGG